MARRGVMTALQAALAGIGGAAGGYVQMEETKRKRMVEDEERKQRQAALEAGLQAGIRAEQRDILRSGGTQIAGLGEQVAGPVPSAIPLSGVGNAFAAAEQAGGPASSRGAMRQTVGGQTFMLPGAAETQATALESALRTARATEELRQEFSAKEKDVANRALYESAKSEYGLREAYNANKNYATVIEAREKQRSRAASMAITPYQQAQLDLDRRRIAIQEESLRRRQSDAEFRQSKLPAAAQKQLAGYEAGVNMAADLRTQIEQKPEALGLKNLAWGQVVNRLDPQGVGVRASIEALSGEIRNQRFGGALTANEAKFAERFLPNASDRADAALAKLGQLENYLEQKRKAVYTVYGGEYQSLRGDSAADQLAALAGPATTPTAAPTVGRDTTVVRPDTMAVRPDTVAATVRPDSALRPTAPTPAQDSLAAIRTAADAFRQMQNPAALEASRQALAARPVDTANIRTFRVSAVPTAADSAAAARITGPVVRPDSTPAPRGGGTEMGMPLSALRRPEPPMIRQRPENIGSLKGIGSILDAREVLTPAFQQAQAPTSPTQLTERQRRQIEEDLARYERLGGALEEVQQSRLFSRSRYARELENQLEEIRLRLGQFGITP